MKYTSCGGYLPSPASPSEAWPWLSWCQQQTQTCPCPRHSESLWFATNRQTLLVRQWLWHYFKKHSPVQCICVLCSTAQAPCGLIWIAIWLIRTTWSQAGLIILARTLSRSCLFRNWNYKEHYMTEYLTQCSDYNGTPCILDIAHTLSWISMPSQHTRPEHHRL